MELDDEDANGNQSYWARVATAGRIRDFKDAEVWQAARELRKEIHRRVRALLDFEKFV